MNRIILGLFCLLILRPFSAASSEIPGWQEVIFKDEPATRLVSGIWHQNRIVAGTHDPGSIYTFGLDPFGSEVKRVFFPDKQAPTEAVLDLIVFQDTLYGMVEKSPSEIRRTNRESGVWEPVEIPSMEGEFQYQCAYPWKGHLYLGTGGWTTARQAKNQARIYRFDGSKRELVLADIQMNGITSLAACGRYLFALADSGWESPEGASALYRTAKGLKAGAPRVEGQPMLANAVTSFKGGSYTQSHFVALQSRT